MSQKLLYLRLVGLRHRWSFEFYGDPDHIRNWVADGLDISEVLNTIPKWAVDLGIPVRWWHGAQDIIHFRNPWRK